LGACVATDTQRHTFEWLCHTSNTHCHTACALYGMVCLSCPVAVIHICTHGFCMLVCAGPPFLGCVAGMHSTSTPLSPPHKAVLTLLPLPTLLSSGAPPPPPPPRPRGLQAVGASERVLNHLNDPPAPQLAAGIRPHEQLRGEIEFKGLSYTYPNR
jgi:hypothetical protein